jgi:hypothetical protein
VADDCYEAQNKTGSLIGRAFVARDMMQIVDALDEDGLLRYWGEETRKAIQPIYQADNLMSFKLLVRYAIRGNSCCHDPRQNGQGGSRWSCESARVFP